MSSAAHEEIRRLLLIIPYVARHPGVRLGVLARKLGVTPKRLRRDLDRLSLIGTPPFGPDDLIDVALVDGRLEVHQAQNFTHPPRLTLREACALWANAQFAMPLFGDALRRARAHLQAALLASERGEFARLCQRLGVPDSPIDGLLEALCQAMRERREIRFDELNAERCQRIERVVEPWALREQRGHWHLEGFCVGRQGLRRFAVERLSALSFTGRYFERRGRGPERQRGARPVLIEADEALIPWLLEELGASALDWRPESGRRVLEVRPEARADFVLLVASLGGRVQILSPSDLIGAVAQVCRRALAEHALMASAEAS
ncbi:MAG: WYL domain-containing protein [Myxococcales bacterium]|jgi:predicted DNA-binding transcriptional regulator YafY|nr:WYL domain-containing protein [Myxococcales bacterium]